MTIKTDDASNPPAVKPFPLLHQLSIISLVSMLLTASVFMFLYQEDQHSEHEDIIAQNGQNSATDLIHSLNDQIFPLVAASNGLDSEAIRTKLDFKLFIDAQEIFRRFGIFKIKLYNQSGVTIYSPTEAEIGETNAHPDMVPKALSGEVTHNLEFKNTFPSSVGEKHNIYVGTTFMPLVSEGKRIGVIETYVDATIPMTRINNITIQIGLIVFFAFALQYAAIFFYVRRTDGAVANSEKSRLALPASAEEIPD